MATRSPHGAALRVGRWSENHRIYLVTTCCHRRYTVFSCLYCGFLVTQEIRHSDRSEATRTLAYVVMPDHLHWLFELRSGHRLRTVVNKLKGRSAFRVNNARRGTGRLWQPGFHDHALRADEAVETVGDYVVHNPVRARLVERPQDYPLTYAAWWPDDRTRWS